jgi:hypothetical protein
MLNTKGQANMIVVLGMVAATIYIMLNAFGYIGNVGLSSKIEITAQNSIYQTLALKDYLIQEATYNFQKAELFDGLTLQPSTLDCGYINTSQYLPFVPVPKIYYWRNLAGQVCLPNNNLIEYGLETLLNKNSFEIINSSNISIQSNLVLNLSNRNSAVFFSNFSAPFLSNKYEFLYNASSTTFSVCEWSPSGCAYVNSNVPLGVNFNLSNMEFTSLPLQDVVSGVIDQSVSVSAFFKGSGLSPSSQYALVTFPDGNIAILYTNTLSGVTSFYLTPMPNENLYSFNNVISYDNVNGISSKIQLFNGSESGFLFDGTNYTFSVTSDTNGIFSIKPTNYVMFGMQPQFVYYKYILNSIQNSGTQNLLFPNNQNLYVSYSLFPLYSPQVCVNYNEGQYDLQNCLTLSDSITGNNYLSQLMQLGIAFVNQSFPIGNQKIEGFAQYEIDNYISNAINAVNLKTISVNGKPKYDWYSALILQLGSPQGTNYLLGKLNRVKEPYYGTYIYNCEQNASDLAYCRNLLSSTLSQDIISLLQQQMPQELSFLSGTNFNINVLNLSINASEISSCVNASNYSVKSNYSYSVKSLPVNGNFSEEILGIPISLDFGYQNSLSLTPTEACGIQKSPYSTGYPGFSEALITNNLTYINCAPVISQSFLNHTCIASLQTSNYTMEQYLNSTSSAVNGEYCRAMANGQYFCPYYKVSSFSYKNWITSSNTCTDYFVLDGKNFTTSQNSNYKLVSVYGGGADSAKLSFYNKTFALYNGSLDLPVNFSFNVGFNATGPYASISAFFSGNSYLSNNVLSASFNSVQDPNGLYNYSVSTDSAELLGGSNNYIYPDTQNELSFNRYCINNNGCNLTAYLNSKFQSSFYSNSTSVTSNVNLLGISTSSKPSSDVISYVFVSNYVPSYKPIENELAYAAASELNPYLNSSFGLTTDNNTYFNEILLNSSSFSSDYQLAINFNGNFNFGYLIPGYVKVFGVYSNNAVSQLYWWNQTQIQNGGLVWVNLTKNVPNELYIVYGQGASYNGKFSDNGSSVFPFFYSVTPNTRPFTFLYPNDGQHDFNAYYSEIGLNLSNTEPVPPYIYNATLNSYYEEFACINTNPFKLTLLNGTYSAYPPNFNINELYNDFSTLYPGLTITGKQTYTNWP